MKTIVELKVFKNGGSNAVRIPASVKLTKPILYLEIDDESDELGLFKEQPQKFRRLFELLDEYGSTSNEDWNLDRDTGEWPERESFKELEGRVK